MEHRRILLLTRGILLLFWCSAIIFAVRGIHDSPLRLGPRWGANMVAVLPEGWAFFTRDPQERTQHIYTRTNAGWVRAIPTNADQVYLFGIKRTQRVQEMEFGSLIAQVPRQRWVPGRSTMRGPTDQEFASPVVVQNRAHRPTLCGDFVVVRRERMPWAWSRSRGTVGMPSTSAAIRVRCGRNPSRLAGVPPAIR